MAESTPVTAQKKQSSPPRSKSFEEYLLDEGHINTKQVIEIHAEQAKNKQTFEEAVLALEIMDEEALAKAKAAYFKLPYIDLSNQKIPKQVLSLISRETLDNYQFVPFARENGMLKVALTNPTDLQALEALEFLAQKNKFGIELYLTSRTGFEEATKKAETIKTEVGEALEVIKEKEKETAATKAETKKQEPKKEERITSASPVARIVDVIIKHAIEARASDIHVEPQENDLRVRYRIDGVLRSSLIVPKIVHPAIVSRVKILSNLKIDEQRLPQDGRFHMDIDKHSIDFRVSTLPTVNGEKVVMRILDKSGGVPTLEELGLTGLKLKRFKENISKAHGMFLVTGPTGSGKSTTLYASLNILNKEGVNIVTMEDPVEYFIGGVNQSQVNPDIGLTFASGLRSILRQDPNIIMVGEIRDAETAELAVHSALTGHLVFSTLHTNNAIGAIPRLVDMGIEKFLLTASLNAVMAQRLVRKICDQCRKEVDPTPEAKAMFEKEMQDIPKEEQSGVDITKLRVFKGMGCKVCGNSGYKGRIAIFEVMPLTEEIKDHLLSNDSATKMLDTAREQGMITMTQDGLIKVLKGITTIEEVIRVTKV